MSEKTTQENPDARSFEERVFARFDALDARLTAVENRIATVETALAAHAAKTETALNTLNGRLTILEERVDERLKETRPMWEGVQFELGRINAKFETCERAF